MNTQYNKQLQRAYNQLATAPCHICARYEKLIQQYYYIATSTVVIDSINLLVLTLVRSNHKR